MNSTLDELRALKKQLEDNGFTLRYAKGAFVSGYCLLHEEKILVLNKFSSDKVKLFTLRSLAKQLFSD